MKKALGRKYFSHAVLQETRTSIRYWAFWRQAKIVQLVLTGNQENKQECIENGLFVSTGILDFQKY